MTESQNPTIGLVAHDLKNTFHLMAIALEELRKHLVDGDEPARAFVELRWLLAHVDYLANALIDGARAQAIERRAISINDFLAEREGALTIRVPSGISLIIRPSSVPGVVLATVPELERVLFTLISNACDAMPEGGDLTISTGWLDQVAGVTPPTVGSRRYVRLTVSDTGHGRDREHNRLLDTSSGDGGLDTGHPDSIVSAVRKLNGWVIIENEDRVGTRVHICLPAFNPQS